MKNLRYFHIEKKYFNNYKYKFIFYDINFDNAINNQNYFFFFFKNKLKKNKQNYLNYMSNLVMQRGLKLKALNFVKSGFKQFFELFLFCNNADFIKKFYYFSILKSYSTS